jgi:hypothetical protein
MPTAPFAAGLKEKLETATAIARSCGLSLATVLQLPTGLWNILVEIADSQGGCPFLG